MQQNPINPAELPLRDIHLPPAVSWFPPAPGWWLLLASLILTIIACVWWLRRYRRGNYRRLALRQLQQLEQQYQQHSDDRQLLQGLSRLLRQAAQLHYPGSACAGLVGNEWLQFLDQPLGGNDFSQGCGQPLAVGPYQAESPELDGSALLALGRRWLRRLPLAPPAERRGK